MRKSNVFCQLCRQLYFLKLKIGLGSRKTKKVFVGSPVIAASSSLTLMSLMTKQVCSILSNQDNELVDLTDSNVHYIQTLSQLLSHVAAMNT